MIAELREEFRGHAWRGRTRQCTLASDRTFCNAYSTLSNSLYCSAMRAGDMIWAPAIWIL